MPWLRVDDTFADHPKIVQLNDREYRIWTKVLLYCARYRTEGDITTKALRTIGATPSNERKFITLGLLDRDDDGTTVVHDFPAYNPSDPTNAERQARYRNSRRNGESNGDRNGESNEDAVTKTSRVTSRTRGGSRARPLPQPLREESVVSKGQKQADPDFPERDPAPEPPYPSGEQRLDDMNTTSPAGEDWDGWLDPSDGDQAAAAQFTPPTLRSIP